VTKSCFKKPTGLLIKTHFEAGGHIFCIDSLFFSIAYFFYQVENYLRMDWKKLFEKAKA